MLQFKKNTLSFGVEISGNLHFFSCRKEAIDNYNTANTAALFISDRNTGEMLPFQFKKNGKELTDAEYMEIKNPSGFSDYVGVITDLQGKELYRERYDSHSQAEGVISAVSNALSLACVEHTGYLVDSQTQLNVW